MASIVLKQYTNTAKEAKQEEDVEELQTNRDFTVSRKPDNTGRSQARGSTRSQWRRPD